MRGEHGSRCRLFRRFSGSSPRARGTPKQHQRTVHPRARFIPACAGNTRQLRVATSTFIPACAGNTGNLRSVLPEPGSSPRARGTPGAGEAPDPDTGSSPRARGTRPAPRFIPALASTSSVHPRVRGEHMCSMPLRSSPRARGTRQSSSFSHVLHSAVHPRVRGEHLDALQRPARGRFIPACAGNTGATAWRPAPAPVHPRVRGEHLPSTTRRTRSTVHPRVRGEHQTQSRTTVDRGRFIPACAGNTRANSILASRTSVHPRVRGEHDRQSPGDALISPVHPRVRGEHVLAWTATADTTGSSPRARGTRERFAQQYVQSRFIPACAGNTAYAGTHSP